MDLGPRDRNRRRGSAARIQKDFTRCVDALEAAAARTCTKTDAECIQDLGVAARRLNVALWLWRAVLVPRARRRARRQLGAIRRRAGRVRELEVQAAQLGGLIKGLPPVTRVAAESILVRLNQDVDRGRKRVARAARPARIRRLVEQVDRARGKVEEKLRLTPESDADVRVRLETARRATLEAIRMAASSNEDRVVHRAGIEVEKLRHSLECAQTTVHARSRVHDRRPAEPSSDPDAPPPVAEGAPPDLHFHSLSDLRRLERTLGRFHDRARLVAVIERRLRRLTARGLVAQAAALEPLRDRLAARREKGLAQFRERVSVHGAETGPAPPDSIVG